MRLIVGLGNPGPEYARTRHNAGFMAVERLASRCGIADPSSGRGRFQGLVVEGVVAGERCILLEPMTYMNRCGASVRQAMDFYKLEVKDVMVLVDDVALPCGRIRLRAEGSAGGHNGLLDIQRAVGTTSYPRLRIGVDPPPPSIPQRDYVLGRFTVAQVEQLGPALDAACDAIECWIQRDLSVAMSRYNAESR